MSDGSDKDFSNGSIDAGRWLRGLAVIVAGLGPMLVAVYMFGTIQAEMRAIRDNVQFLMADALKKEHITTKDADRIFIRIDKLEQRVHELEKERR